MDRWCLQPQGLVSWMEKSWTKMIDQNIVKKLFYYDAESGMLIWRNGNGRNVKPWQQVKASNGHGYYTAKINGKSYLVHRLAWLYVHGEFPKQDIDHKNRIRNDNRLCNLRSVSRTDNCQNIDQSLRTQRILPTIQEQCMCTKQNHILTLPYRSQWAGNTAGHDAQHTTRRSWSRWFDVVALYTSINNIPSSERTMHIIMDTHEVNTYVHVLQRTRDVRVCSHKIQAQ
jgi:hypothetical protein